MILMCRKVNIGYQHIMFTPSYMFITTLSAVLYIITVSAVYDSGLVVRTKELFCNDE